MISFRMKTKNNCCTSTLICRWTAYTTYTIRHIIYYNIVKYWLGCVVYYRYGVLRTFCPNLHAADGTLAVVKRIVVWETVRFILVCVVRKTIHVPTYPWTLINRQSQQKSSPPYALRKRFDIINTIVCVDSVNPSDIAPILSSYVLHIGIRDTITS